MTVDTRTLKVMQMIAAGARNADICRYFGRRDLNGVSRILKSSDIKPPHGTNGPKRAQWARDWLADHKIEFENLDVKSLNRRPTAQSNTGCRYYIASKRAECGAKIDRKKHPQYCPNCAAKSARGALNMFNNHRDFSALI